VIYTKENMLTSFFGMPLRKVANIIAIVNFIASICYILYYVWEYQSNYGYPLKLENEFSFESSLDLFDELFSSYITLVFMLVGLTSLFANFGLKQATLKNKTHKIYLWLLINYIQLGSVVVIEICVLIRGTYAVKEIVGLIILFILIDAFMVFQLLVIQSFYIEEKLVEETNYTKLRSELSSQILQQQPDDDFQNIELDL